MPRPNASFKTNSKPIAGRFLWVKIKSLTKGPGWIVGYQYAAPQKGAKLHLRFVARDVHLVMRPVNADSPQVKVLLDGQVVSAIQAGADVDNGLVTLDKDRLYNLIHLETAGDHELTLEFPEDNGEVFAFTFG